MHIDWWTLALQTVNFAVLVWLLNRFLYKPVLRMIDARKAEIDKQFDKAAKAETQARADRQAVAAEREGIAAERAASLKTATAEAEKAAAARRAEAEKEATAIVEGARKTIAAERGEALAEARHAALDLGTDIARRLLDEIPSEMRAEVWLEEIERHIGDLSSEDHARIEQGLADGRAVQVVTAAAISQKLRQTWRKRLAQALGREITVSFKTDAGLIAGAELHFANAILRFTWADTLDKLRREVDRQ